MGCDIHLMTEVKRNGAWESADSWNMEDDTIWPDSIYKGRNYDMFAVLADVRNGVGFAGRYTGSGFKPIAAPRGAPEDASSEVKAYTDSWEADGHSHSYFTLAELLAYDWDQTTTYITGDKATCRQACDDFIENTIPELMKLGGYENVRIVFFFDN